jgi:predicted AlkP superfamily phosphohydrolase/phosphomutase
MSKVIIIGLDGATFDLIRPWVDEGKLPCLGKLMKNGVWGNLMSVIPSMSGPAWVSFMTGKNPGKHGILGFSTYADKDEEQSQLISSLLVKDETLWQVLSSHGKRVGVMNVPVTYPPRKVNGFLISGFMTPPSATVFTYPEELKQSIPNYRIGIRQRWQGEDGRASIRKLKDELVVREYHDIAERRTAAAVQLMSHWKPDFFMVVFKGTDEMQHFFWGRENILLEYYRKIDENIECILAEGGKDSNVLIISDHGFGPATTRLFSTNSWLQQAGLLKRKRDLKSSLLRTASHIAWDLNRRTRFAKRLPPRRVAAVRKAVRQGLAWNRTRAYCRKPSGIVAVNINLRGREPRGIVEPGQEYEELREEIIAKLRLLTDPQTGEKVMAEVYRNNEIYWGPKLNNVPDIIGVPNPRYYVDASVFTRSIFADRSSRQRGQHYAQVKGILITSGPDVKPCEKIEGARLIDIAPTVLHMMGLPVPQDMDGRVLKEIFREDSEPAQRDVKYQQLDVERERVESKITNLKRLGRI